MSTTFYRGEDPLRADKLNTALSERVSRAGDVMQGLLTLSRDPVSAFDAATKQYVDRLYATGLPPGGPYLPLAGNATVFGPTTFTGPLYWTATGSTASRSAQDRSADWVNLRDCGAVLDGVVNDSTAYAAARTAASSRAGNIGGVIVAPPNSKRGSLTAPIFSAPAVLWQIDGMSFGTSGLTPVTAITTGDLVETFFSGQKYYGRTDPVGATLSPMMRFDYSGAGTSSGVLQLNVTGNDGNAYTTAILSRLTLTSAGTATGPTCIAAQVTNIQGTPGSGSQGGWTWWGVNSDQTGLGIRTLGGQIGMENGIVTNGLDNSGVYFNPASGGRVNMHLVNSNFVPPSWAANHAYAAAAVVTPGNGFTYIAQNAATSGATAPVWPTVAGTVVDGGVTWAFGTTVQGQVSRALQINGNANLGAAILIGGPGSISDAGIDMCQAVLDTTTNPNAAAIRIGANMPIDFSGDGTAAGQNQHTLQYTTSGTARLRYMAGATEAVAISDNGGLSSPSLPTNVLFYGAKMDGTTNDATAFQAATAVTPADGTITVPRGGFNVLTAPTRASGNVLWQLDGNKFGTGTTPVVFTGSPGDVTETFVQGRKSFKKQVTNAQSIAVVEVNLDYQWTTAPSNAVSSGVHVICTPGVTTGNTFVWGINSELNSATNGTNQHLAGAFTTRKAGTAPCFALFAQMLDNTGSPSSVSGGAVTCEFDLFANGLDDAPLGARNVLGVIYGRSDRTGSGTDMSVHKALTIGPQPVEVAHASADIMINLYGTFNQSGLDSRPATQGPSANAIWLGDNHTVALNTAGTAKFQYRTATSRLYYSVAGVDMWSVDANGNVRAKGTFTGSTTP